MAIDDRLLPGGSEGEAIRAKTPSEPVVETTSGGTFPWGDKVATPWKDGAPDATVQGTIPGGSEVWLVGGTPYLIYYVPNTNPPVPMAWQIRSDEDIIAIFGEKPPTYSQVLTMNDFTARGAIPMGGSTELANVSEHPFETFMDTFEKEAQIRPWLRDPEILAITAGAILEGREVTDAEFMTTNWWQTHTDTERKWLSLNASDPATAQQMVEDQRLAIAEALREYGMADPPDELVNLVAGNALSGAWGIGYVAEQLQKLADPAAPGELDEVFAEFTGLDTTRGKESEVRSEVERWLGASYADAYSPKFISDWAGKLRNDDDAALELEDLLRNQRLALFPTYENPNLTYQDIAQPWKQVFFNAWGQEASEMDPFFNTIVGMNDHAEATKLLTSEGLKRGIGKPTNDALGQLTRSMGGGVRQADRGVL